MSLLIPFYSSSAALFLWISTAWRVLAERIKGIWPRWQHESLALDHNTTDNPSCATEQALPNPQPLTFFFSFSCYSSTWCSQLLSLQLFSIAFWVWLLFWLSLVLKAWPQLEITNRKAQMLEKQPKLKLLVSSRLGHISFWPVTKQMFSYWV